MRAVFIAGPLGGVNAKCDARSQHQRVMNAVSYGELVHSLCPNVMPVVPHLFWYWATMVGSNFTRDNWLTFALELAMRCDALVRIPGASQGADGEEDLMARVLGRPVFFTDNLGHVPHALEVWANKALPPPHHHHSIECPDCSARIDIPCMRLTADARRLR